jgi:MinD superfamily P-loop ATPase
MTELVVISGKGGTGKTSILASFAALARGAVLADTDVDAADLHLLLAPTIRRRQVFRCGHEAVIRQEDCVRCGACLARCRFGAVCMGEGGAGESEFRIDATACEGCGVCVRACPTQAIDFPERESGEWYVSDTRLGPLVHARLVPGGENSGKLVSQVRTAARELAVERGVGLLLVDGPPGVGCPVIAAISGAAQVLVVTEPTLSGLHDLARVLELTRHFGLPAAVCVNKWDINPELAERIETAALQQGAGSVGRVRYDRSVTQAQVAARTVVEMGSCAVADDIRAVWRSLLSVQEGRLRPGAPQGRPPQAEGRRAEAMR